MRYLLAAALAFACALGLPAASALPAFGPHWDKASPIAPVAKRSTPNSRRHGRSHGGIHALVGSGDY